MFLKLVSFGGEKERGGPTRRRTAHTQRSRRERPRGEKWNEKKQTKKKQKERKKDFERKKGEERENSKKFELFFPSSMVLRRSPRSFFPNEGLRPFHVQDPKRRGAGFFQRLPS
jgi:hypothetical protein